MNPLTGARLVVVSLRRARWFTIGSALTFALALGVNLAVFAVVDRVLFKPLPFRDVDRLATAFSYSRITGDRFFVTSKSLLIGLRRAGAIEGFAFAGRSSPYRLSGRDERVILTRASWNLLDLLGAPVAAGRSFSAADLEAGRRTALIREEIWTTRFGRAPDILGALVLDEGAPVEVVGILPRGFVTPSVNWNASVEGLIMDGEPLDSSAPGDAIPGVVVRIAAGHSMENVQRSLSALAETPAERRPDGSAYTVLLEPLRRGVFWRDWSGLRLLFGAAVLVLMLGGINLGTAILARAQQREVEIGTRLALGASRGEIARLILFETLFICGLGGAVALVAFSLTAPVLVALVPGFFRPMVNTAPDPRLFGMALLTTVAGSTVASVAPVWQTSRINVVELLRGKRRASREGRRATASLLVVVQTAMSTALVVFGMLAATHFIKFVTSDLGFEPARLYLAYAGGPARQGSDLDDIYRRTAELVTRLPEVESASRVSAALTGRDTAEQLITELGRPIPVRRVSGSYFTTMGTPMVAGRDYSVSEVATAAPVIVVSQASLSVLFPHSTADQALGQIVRLVGEPAREVIGVAKDARSGPSSSENPEVFIPAKERQAGTLIIRARPGVLLSQRVLHSAFETSGFTEGPTVVSVEQQLAESAEEPRLYAHMLGGFALVALFLSLVGLASLTSQRVSAKLYELGVMTALGATPAQIRRSVILTAVRPVIVGITIGGAVSWWSIGAVPRLSALAQGQGFAPILIVALMLLATAVATVWFPAGRAARLDPALSLRSR